MDDDEKKKFKNVWILIVIIIILVLGALAIGIAGLCIALNNQNTGPAGPAGPQGEPGVAGNSITGPAGPQGQPGILKYDNGQPVITTVSDGTVYLKSLNSGIYSVEPIPDTLVLRNSSGLIKIADSSATDVIPAVSIKGILQQATETNPVSAKYIDLASYYTEEQVNLLLNPLEGVINFVNNGGLILQPQPGQTRAGYTGIFNYAVDISPSSLTTIYGTGNSGSLWLTSQASKDVGDKTGKLAGGYDTQNSAGVFQASNNSLTTDLYLNPAGGLVRTKSVFLSDMNLGYGQLSITFTSPGKAPVTTYYNSISIGSEITLLNGSSPFNDGYPKANYINFELLVGFTSSSVSVEIVGTFNVITLGCNNQFYNSFTGTSTSDTYISQFYNPGKSTVYINGVVNFNKGDVLTIKIVQY